jgi:hypothetical protein
LRKLIYKFKQLLLNLNPRRYSSEDRLTALLAEELRKEIDKEILKRLKTK